MLRSGPRPRPPGRRRCRRRSAAAARGDEHTQPCRGERGGGALQQAARSGTRRRTAPPCSWPRASAASAHACAVAWRARCGSAPTTIAAGTPAPASCAAARHRSRARRARRIGRAGDTRPRSCGSRDRLQLGRGLAFVVDARAQPAERRDRVEQPARACRERRRRAPPAASSATASQRRGSTGGERGRHGGRVAERLDEPRARHAPRLADRLLAAGHADRMQVPDALEAAQVAVQQLAAPDRAVGPVAGAVVDRADRGLRLAVLGEAGGEVGVVVLHADVLDAVALERVRGRQVVAGAGRVRPPRARPRTAARSARCPPGTSASVS